MGDDPGFYNAPSRKVKHSQKLLVGSFNVNAQQKAAPHPGIGNQVERTVIFIIGQACA